MIFVGSLLIGRKMGGLLVWGPLGQERPCLKDTARFFFPMVEGIPGIGGGLEYNEKNKEYPACAGGDGGDAVCREPHLERGPFYLLSGYALL